MNWFLLPISHLTHMSFCTQGLPRSCRIHISKSEDNPSPWGEGARQGGWGLVESVLPRPHPPSATVPPLPEGEGYFLDDGFCDFAFGSAQNDRVVWVVGKRISFRTRETNKKSLMLCALLLGWCSVDCFLVDAMCLGFWLMLCKLVLIDSCLW